MELEDYFSKQVHSFLTLVGPLATEFYGGEEPLVFVDGGARLRKGSSGFSVGDGDSATTALDQKLNSIKNFSDLAFVLCSVPSFIRKIQMIGFSGGRRDHELMNWAEVHRFLCQTKDSTEVFIDMKIIAFSAGEWTFQVQGLFSIFTFEATKILLNGACQYHLTEGDTFKSLSSHGLSNNGFGEVRLTCDKPVFIFK